LRTLFGKIILILDIGFWISDLLARYQAANTFERISVNETVCRVTDEFPDQTNPKSKI
jgi:hypothetical protein